MTLDTLLIVVIVAGVAVILWRALGIGDIIQGWLPVKKLETLAPNRSGTASAPVLPTHWPVNHHAIWADRVAATARGLHKHLDLERYTFLLAPRMSDFLAVSAKVVGSQKAIALDNHLRNNRVGCAFLEIASGRPCGAFLFGSGQEFQVARRAFEATGFPFAIVEPTSQASVREGLQALGLLRVADASRPAEAPQPAAEVAAPASDASAAPAEPSKPKPAAATPPADASAKTAEADTPAPSRPPSSRSAPRKKAAKSHAGKSQDSSGRKSTTAKATAKSPATAAAADTKLDLPPLPKGLFE